jgi:hypothetical protein
MSFGKALEICEMVEDPPCELHATLLAMLALNLQLANKPAIHLAERILELAKNKKNSDVEKLGLAIKGFILSRNGSLKEGVEYLMKSDQLFLKQKPSEYTRHLPAASAIWNRCNLFVLMVFFFCGCFSHSSFSLILNIVFTATQLLWYVARMGQLDKAEEIRHGIEAAVQGQITTSKIRRFFDIHRILTYWFTIGEAERLKSLLSAEQQISKDHVSRYLLKYDRVYEGFFLFFNNFVFIF